MSWIDEIRKQYESLDKKLGGILPGGSKRKPLLDNDGKLVNVDLPDIKIDPDLDVDIKLPFSEVDTSTIVIVVIVIGIILFFVFRKR